MTKLHKIILFSLIVVVLLLALLLFLPGDHDDVIYYNKPDPGAVTLEQLLSPPYVTEGVWTFTDMWMLYNNGDHLETGMAEKDLYISLAEDLQEILNGHPLLPLIPEEDVKDYDAYVSDLLDVSREELPLFIYLTAGTNTSRMQDGNVLPDSISIISLDGSRCYIDIGYQTISENTKTHYVYYTDDPALSEALFSYAQALIAKQTK